MSRHLLPILISKLGRESALQEFKWMQDAVKSSAHRSYVPNLAEMVKRRSAGEPLQYILGTQPFGPLELLVRAPTLIPRPETEDWTIKIANLFKPSLEKPISILDLCTGSGCIPILLCHVWLKGSTRAVGVDVAEHALKLAKDNAVRCNISTKYAENRSDTKENTLNLLLADIHEENFVSKLKCISNPPFDLITSNPPYIPHSEYVKLPDSVKLYEDPRALLGDPDGVPNSSTMRGLAFYERIAWLIGHADLLKSGGMVALEVGHDQSYEVDKIMRDVARVGKVEIWRDPWDVERVVVAWK